MSSASRRRQRDNEPSAADVRATNRTTHLFVGNRQYGWMSNTSATATPTNPVVRNRASPSQSASTSLPPQPETSPPQPLSTSIDAPTPRPPPGSVNASHPSATTSTASSPPSQSNTASKSVSDAPQSQYPPQPPAQQLRQSVYPDGTVPTSHPQATQADSCMGTSNNSSSTVPGNISPFAHASRSIPSAGAVDQVELSATAVAHLPPPNITTQPERGETRPPSALDRSSESMPIGVHPRMRAVALPPLTVRPPNQNVLPSPTPSNDEGKSSSAVRQSSASVTSGQQQHQHRPSTTSLNGISINSPVLLSQQRQFSSEPFPSPTTPIIQSHQTVVYDPIILRHPDSDGLLAACPGNKNMEKLVSHFREATHPATLDQCFIQFMQLRCFACFPNALPRDIASIPNIHAVFALLDQAISPLPSYPMTKLLPLLAPLVNTTVRSAQTIKAIQSNYALVRASLEALAEKYVAISKWVREDKSAFIWEDLVLTFRIPSRILRRELERHFLVTTYPDILRAEPRFLDVIWNTLGSNEQEHSQRQSLGAHVTGRSAAHAMTYYRTQLRSLLAAFSGGSPRDQNAVPNPARSGDLAPEVGSVAQAVQSQVHRETRSLAEFETLCRQFGIDPTTFTSDALRSQVFSQLLAAAQTGSQPQATRPQVILRTQLPAHSPTQVRPFIAPVPPQLGASGHRLVHAQQARQSVQHHQDGFHFSPWRTTRNSFFPRPNVAPSQATPHQPGKYSLHQAHLNSPELQFAEPYQQTFYRVVRAFALPPSTITNPDPSPDLPPEYFYNPPQQWNFLLSESVSARLAKSSIGDNQRVRLANSNSITIRLRCCRHVGTTDWMTQDPHWPAATNFSVNGTRLHPRLKLNHGRDLPIDITDAVRAGQNIVEFTSARPKHKPVAGYAIAVEMVGLTSHDQVLNDCKKLSAKDSWQALREKFSQTDDDDEVMCLNETLTISVVDLFLQRIWDTPARGAQCRHPECFDLETFLATRSRIKPNQPSSVDDWRCPFCKGDASPNALIIDEWMLGVREELARQQKLDARAIEVDENGAWKVKDESKATSSGTKRKASEETAEQGASATKRIEPVVISLD
ncbi:hypothetical protein FH972_025191 [Carpinus fangiana]|uniref:SP-RING-type domain-containing protein n=1 Tax=Carpinus fangiana TaxID=176857 RepID=A0A5N6L2V9_9ROSI|nr:hypothetical protein FH972_025191 [Carpinus fangiana]